MKNLKSKWKMGRVDETMSFDLVFFRIHPVISHLENTKSFAKNWIFIFQSSSIKGDCYPKHTSLGDFFETNRSAAAKIKKKCKKGGCIVAFSPWNNVRAYIYNPFSEAESPTFTLHSRWSLIIICLDWFFWNNVSFLLLV